MAGEWCGSWINRPRGCWISNLERLCWRFGCPIALRRLARLARRTGRTKTFYAREAILQYLDDLEDLYLAEQRLKDLRAGRSRTYSLDEVEAMLARTIEFGDAPHGFHADGSNTRSFS